jgi:hypothetical protein
MFLRSEGQKNGRGLTRGGGSDILEPGAVHLPGERELAVADAGVLGGVLGLAAITGAVAHFKCSWRGVSSPWTWTKTASLSIFRHVMVSGVGFMAITADSPSASVLPLITASGDLPPKVTPANFSRESPFRGDLVVGGVQWPALNWAASAFARSRRRRRHARHLVGVTVPVAGGTVARIRHRDAPEGHQAHARSGRFPMLRYA